MTPSLRLFQRLAWTAPVLLFLFLLTQALVRTQAENDEPADKRKIYIVAGPPSHPSGQHEFYAGAMILQRALNEQSGLPLEAIVYKHAWPEDPAAFENAAAVVIYSDGGGGHPAGPHLDELDALLAKGVGLMCMHYAVEVPKGDWGDRFTRWIGGFYEGGFSVNPHWNAKMEANRHHPVSRGVGVTLAHDEWYFNIRFPQPKQAVDLMTALPTEEALTRRIHWNPAGDAALGKDQALMWGIQRPDGGRGVGFTGGHWHYNWAIDEFRTLVLNAIVWTAGLDVPESGVKSDPVAEEQLNENLDPKGDMVRVQLPDLPVPKKD
ncbi:MAG TPA: ThuA domain-containing protein [Verrucomicrobiales bacterium]|nr:ThuA domain-containing protein [Verrucomicrobiales bacterium]